MESTYVCEICGTKPVQLSHHKAHLKTLKHDKNCDNFVTEMKIFSIPFRIINPKEWEESKYKDYIIYKYKRDNNTDIIDYAEIKKYLCFKGLTDEKYDWSTKIFNNKNPVECYEEEKNCKLEVMDSIKLNQTYEDYNSWGINRILKDKETVRSKPAVIKTNSLSSRHHRSNLSRYTNVKFNKIENIRNGLIDIRYILQPKHMLKLNDYDMEIYNDDAVKYSCVLFDKCGIESLYDLYNDKWAYGITDIEEHPEEKKDYTYYFYKEVEFEYTSKFVNVINYPQTRNEKKKIWVSCDMGNFLNYLYYLDDPENDIYKDEPVSIEYTYISNEDFKYFVKETLIEVFSHKIQCIKQKIEEVEKLEFKAEWKNHDNKISSCYFIGKNEEIVSGCYLIGKNEAIVKKFDGKICVYNMFTDEERELLNEKKITEEQRKEYLKFKSDNATSIQKLKDEIEYCELEMYKIKEYSLSSETITSIVQICQYLFEYNDDLIEYHKKNRPVSMVNNDKALELRFERMRLEGLLDEDEGILDEDEGILKEDEGILNDEDCCIDIDYRYIHCITNTDNKLKTYFLHETDATDFLSYDYLQVSLLRVAVDSPEHDIAVANTYKTRNGLRTI
jgi:hypothetical protein